MQNMFLKKSEKQNFQNMEKQSKRNAKNGFMKTTY